MSWENLVPQSDEKSNVKMPKTKHIYKHALPILKYHQIKTRGFNDLKLSGFDLCHKSFGMREIIFCRGKERLRDKAFTACKRLKWRVVFGHKFQNTMYLRTRRRKELISFNLNSFNRKSVSIWKSQCFSFTVFQSVIEIKYFSPAVPLSWYLKNPIIFTAVCQKKR